MDLVRGDVHCKKKKEIRKYSIWLSTKGIDKGVNYKSETSKLNSCRNLPMVLVARDRKCGTNPKAHRDSEICFSETKNDNKESKNVSREN